MAIAQTDVQRATPPYALVVFAVLSVILAASSVWLYLKWDKSQKKATELEQQQSSLLAAREAGDKSHQEVIEEAQNAEGSPSVVSYLMAQRAGLRTSVAGDAALSNADIQSRVDAALKDAQSSLSEEGSGGLSGLPLVEVIKNLTNAYSAQRLAISELDSARKAAQDSEQRAQQQLQAVKATASQNLGQVRSDVKARWDQLDEYLKVWEANLEELRGHLATMQESKRKGEELAQEQLDAMQAELDDNKDRLGSLIEKVQKWRGEGGIEFAGMVSRADGKIVKIVPGQNMILIDIGEGEHLPLSLKFEVFSPTERLTDRTKSKATIEVVRVSPKVSECQIVRTARNQTIMPGDVIVNAVYDRQNQYIFRVIGGFDLDGSGDLDVGGAQSLEALIERWGGQVVGDLHVQTDFLVVGSEPQVPIEPDGFDQAAVALYEQKVKERAAYVQEQDRAVKLSIPILNHKRFLYLLGLGDRSELEPVFSEEELGASAP